MKHLKHSDDPGTVLTHLMQTYGKDVWNYAVVITGNSDAADEISQDVFLKVYLKMDSFEGRSSVKTWLLAITRNTALKHRKSLWLRNMFRVLFPREYEHNVSAEKEAI
ncbi:RNA polymerase sigma factor [Paenibacillus chartarius]|uniref:RNA polymerase sigma factor n=1 Tax=Paenibacillus chartarius TaxID=747481 RepID=A0ABV6DVL5_9BACL